MSRLIELGTILRDFPSSFRSGHGLVDIRDAYLCGWANRLWNRTHAVRVLFAANMERAESYGAGNRASRRATAIDSAKHYREQFREGAL